MLELRPNCEYCDRDLPPASAQARICSYECTFCAECVTRILHNVCPNCGGGFAPRPVRPLREYRDQISLLRQPASNRRVYLKHGKATLPDFIAAIKDTRPGDR